MAGGRFRVFDEAKAEPRFGEHVPNEIDMRVGPVLHAVVARAELRDTLVRVRREAPAGDRAVRREHRAEHVRDALPHERALVAPVRERGEPRHELQVVPREAGVVADALGLRHEPAAHRARAVRECGANRHALAEHRVEIETGIGRERVDVPLEIVGERLAPHPALDLQRRDFARPIEGIETIGSAEKRRELRDHAHENPALSGFDYFLNTARCDENGTTNKTTELRDITLERSR